MNEQKVEKPTQQERIEVELKLGRKLTGIDIMNMGIMNYKGRIWDLRESGIEIDTEYIKTKTGSRIALYFLKNKQLQMKM